MYSFILNPNARSGRAAKVRPAIERFMETAGLDFTVVETKSSSDAIESSRRAAMTSLTVISVGGDGTLHYVATGVVEARLAGSSAVLGILPAGTGNDFGRMIGMPAGTEASLNAILTAKPTALDHGWASWEEKGIAIRRAFINCAGIGLDAKSAAVASRLKRYVGNLAYLAAPALVMLSWPSPEAEVSILSGETGANERWSGKLILASVANGKWIGGGIEVSPQADCRDGALDLCLIRHLSLPRAYRLLARAAKGRHVGSPDVLMRKIRRVTVTVSEPLPVYVDGEPGSDAVTSVTFDVAAGEIPVLVPI